MRSPKPARIMIVEDESIVIMELRDRLEARGYEVVAEAFTGNEAIEKANAARPDLVLMDIRLRGPIDGIQAAQKIREQKRQRSLKKGFRKKPDLSD